MFDIQDKTSESKHRIVFVSTLIEVRGVQSHVLPLYGLVFNPKAGLWNSATPCATFAQHTPSKPFAL
jgi:hypothetical protein